MSKVFCGSSTLKTLWVTLTALAVVGVFSLYESNVLPVVTIFEVILIVLSLLFISKLSLLGVVFSLFSFLYILFSSALALYYDVNYLDFIQAYKAFFYVLVLLPFFGKNIFHSDFVRFLYITILLLFLTKYSYSIAFNFTDRMGSRPGLFAENNFELVFLAFLYYFATLDNIKYKNIFFALFALVVIMSGSRSGLGILLVSFYFSYFRFNLLGIITSSIGLLILFGFVLYFFMVRTDGQFYNIDRFKFLSIWLYETSSWEWWRYLIGNASLTPLSSESCSTLSYWSSLFSFSGDGSCYSVILHSYILRVVFDHGVLGLVFLLAFSACGVLISGLKFRSVLFVWGVLLASALSVSSFNSVFSAISLAIAFGYYSKSGDSSVFFRKSALKSPA
ncbi:hypothetical protein [Motiliproteus coralliicola]|uniref:hypothetical protein n=1 Tax=Motiliproteus coralliicola TaxID=2283196 RepID=UPI0010586317|nr:hypothetical protein [Motiliproteus coralliicola]